VRLVNANINTAKFQSAERRFFFFLEDPMDDKPDAMVRLHMIVEKAPRRLLAAI
jgi:hypothetical protein